MDVGTGAAVFERHQKYLPVVPQALFCGSSENKILTQLTKNTFPKLFSGAATHHSEVETETV